MPPITFICRRTQFPDQWPLAVRALLKPVSSTYFSSGRTSSYPHVREGEGGCRLKLVPQVPRQLPSGSHTALPELPPTPGTPDMRQDSGEVTGNRGTYWHVASIASTCTAPEARSTPKSIRLAFMAQYDRDTKFDLVSGSSRRTFAGYEWASKTQSRLYRRFRRETREFTTSQRLSSRVSQDLAR